MLYYTPNPAGERERECKTKIREKQHIVAVTGAITFESESQPSLSESKR